MMPFSHLFLDDPQLADDGFPPFATTTTTTPSRAREMVPYQPARMTHAATKPWALSSRQMVIYKPDNLDSLGDTITSLLDNTVSGMRPEPGNDMAADRDNGKSVRPSYP